MITLYSVPRPFDPPFDTLQTFAIASWLRLDPAPQIVLVGALDTLKESVEFGVEFANGGGEPPLVRDVIQAAEDKALYDLRCFLNTDNVLMDKFYEVLAPVFLHCDRFVCIGRRTNYHLDIWHETGEPPFGDSVRDFGTPGGSYGCDFFIYRGVSLAEDMPDFTIGRDFYDNWLVRKLAASDVPLIDVSNVLTVVHLNHPRKPTATDGEMHQNRAMAELDGRYGLKDATWRLTHEGLRKVR